MAAISRLMQVDSVKAVFSANYAKQKKARENPKGVMSQVVIAAESSVSLDSGYAANLDEIASSINSYVRVAKDYLQISCVQGTTSADSVAQDTLRLATSRSTLTGAATTARDDQGQLETVLREPMNFYRVQRLGPHSNSSRDSISVGRRPIPVIASGSGADMANSGATRTKQNTTADTSTHYITIATSVVLFGYDKFLEHRRSIDDC